MASEGFARLLYFCMISFGRNITVMAEKMKMWSTNVSRRAAIIGLTSAILAAHSLDDVSGLGSEDVKASVAYQNSPKGSQSCANCQLFIPPASCRLVEGSISSHGWCKLWVGK